MAHLTIIIALFWVIATLIDPLFIMKRPPLRGDVTINLTPSVCDAFPYLVLIIVRLDRSRPSMSTVCLVSVCRLSRKAQVSENNDSFDVKQDTNDR